MDGYIIFCAQVCDRTIFVTKRDLRGHEECTVNMKGEKGEGKKGKGKMGQNHDVKNYN